MRNVWPLKFSGSIFYALLLVFVAILLAGAMFYFIRVPDISPDLPSRRIDSSLAKPRLQTSLIGSTEFGFDQSARTDDFNKIEVINMDEVIEDNSYEAPWESAIHSLLDSDEENDVVATKLAGLAPSLPADGQVEAVQHMVNLLDDQKYSLARNMMLNPGLRPELLEVLFSDVQDRPNEVKMPVLLAIFGQPGHPFAADAKSSLQDFVGQDFGPNPASWVQPIQESLSREALDEASSAPASSDLE